MSKKKPLTDPEQYEQLVRSKLFKPLTLYPEINLQNRIVMAPMTRNRSHNFNPDKEQMCKYYSDRSKTPGTLVITEATYIGSEYTGLIKDAPGIFTDEQFESWKYIFSKIHLNRSFVFAQLWAPGRQADPEVLLEMGLRYYGVSPVYESSMKKELAHKIGNKLMEISILQLANFKKSFLKLCKEMLRAGADGIEIHACSGSLLHQFLSSVSNTRKDKYGGSIENRARFVLELLDYVVQEIPASKIGIRLSPFTKCFSISNTDGIVHDTISQHAYLLERLESRANRSGRLAYVHVVESKGDVVTNDFVLSIWKGVLIRCGEYLHRIPKLIHDVNLDNTLIAVGRYYISNPDLYYRIKCNVALTEPRLEFFNFGGETGYNDYDRFDGL